MPLEAANDPHLVMPWQRSTATEGSLGPARRRASTIGLRTGLLVGWVLLGEPPAPSSPGVERELTLVAEPLSAIISCCQPRAVDPRPYRKAWPPDHLAGRGVAARRIVRRPKYPSRLTLAWWPGSRIVRPPTSWERRCRWLGVRIDGKLRARLVHCPNTRSVAGIGLLALGRRPARR